MSSTSSFPAPAVAASLLDALDGHGQGLWDWSLEHGEIWRSAEYHATLGTSATDPGEASDDRDWQLRLHPDDREPVLARLHAHLRGETALFYSEHRLRRSDGRYCRVAVRGRVVERDADNAPQRMLGSLLNIDAHKSDPRAAPQGAVAQAPDIRAHAHYENELRNEKELAQVTLAAIADAVLRTDRDGRIGFCNAAALRLLGHEQPGEIEGHPFTDRVTLFDEHGTTPLAEPVWQALCDRRAADSVPPLVQLRTARGEQIPVELSIASLRAGDGERLGCVCVLRDLSHTRLLSEQLIHQASHDALTDLPNRREFEAELAHWLSTARLGVSRHALLYLDLDHFKLINETAGHSAGDRLVCEIAARLRQTLPPQAVLARTGGDEFAVVLPHATLDDAQQIGDSLLKTIAAMRFEHESRSYRLAASVGISVINSETPDTNTVLAEADTACYVAKRHGGDRCQVYSPGDAAVRQAFADSSWASRIQQSLENGDVMLYGQRIESIRTGAAPSFEVLIRVRDEHGTLQRPLAFLSAAERYGLSADVDRWVIEQTLATLAHCLAARGELPCGYVAINLTAHSASDPAFADFLFEALSRHAIPPQRLRFEITEGMALRNFNAARQLVARLREYGCRIMLDDFGSGFTSFDYLRQMPVDGLKIDMTYTHRLANDTLNQTIVESICRIGKALNLEVVAEGVEEASTLETLRRLGADYAQGHLFHVAEPLAALLAG